MVLDVHTRRLVGWQLASHMRQSLVSDAFEMALSARQEHAGGLVAHSDNGSQAGFNWSSQHLECGGADGQASGVDDGVDGQVPDEVAGGSGAAA